MLRATRLLLALAVALSLGTPAPAQAKPLRALVWEHVDPHSKATGAREALKRAGFEVDELSVKMSASSARADLIALASFVSEHGEYDKYMASRGEGLVHFMRKGGVVLQMTQADQTEETPPFLPDGLVALRGDVDTERTYAEAPGHPLIAGLERYEKEPERVRVRKHGAHKTSWETYVWQEGFRVLLSATKEREQFALLEAQVGAGRLLLSSLHFDKQRNADGRELTKPETRVHADRFFEGLAVYVRAVRAGTAPAATPTPPRVEATPQLGEPTPVAWRLALSDMALYERKTVQRKGGLLRKKTPKPFTVHGHDLTDGRQYLPAAPLRRDLAGVLAFRLPRAHAGATELDITREFRALVPVQFTGRVAARRITGREEALVTSAYTFASKGRLEDEHKHRIESGNAEVRAVFDLAEGVFRSSRVELRYDLARVDAGRGEKPKHASEHFEWTLKDVKRHRYKAFQDDVDTAIEKGVAWLRKERNEEGRWKAHGRYDVGPTALVLLTLVACDVPRDDPIVTETLDWIFQQTARRNYERAVCLMAIDRAYAPPHEAAAMRDRIDFNFVRDLPPKRLAWCKEVAHELETGASQPGSWGYPNGGTDVQRFDTSNTQYAVLGLRAATHLGIPIAEKTWLGVLRHFKTVREKDGPKGAVASILEGQAIRNESQTTQGAIPVRHVAGFRYSPLHGHRRPWASMTCAGIASLGIARHQLERMGSSKLTPKMSEEIEQMMLGGWAWLDQHWAMDRHPQRPGDTWYHYFLYSLERAGILHGVKRVGGKDWYFEGASQLIARQKKKGGWGDGEKPRIADTCFALLFLKRATAPLTGR